MHSCAPGEAAGSTETDWPAGTDNDAGQKPEGSPRKVDGLDGQQRGCIGSPVGPWPVPGMIPLAAMGQRP